MENLGVEFKKIIKMIKWWNKQHSDYMESGIHIEVIGLYALTGFFDSFSWNVYKYFETAARVAQSPLWHELSFADQYLIDRPSWRPEVVKRLESVRDKALALGMRLMEKTTTTPGR